MESYAIFGYLDKTISGDSRIRPPVHNAMSGVSEPMDLSDYNADVLISSDFNNSSIEAYKAMNFAVP